MYKANSNFTFHPHETLIGGDVLSRDSAIFSRSPWLNLNEIIGSLVANAEISRPTMGLACKSISASCGPWAGKQAVAGIEYLSF